MYKKWNRFCILAMKGSKAAAKQPLISVLEKFLAIKRQERELGNTEFGKFANTTTTSDRNKVHGRIDRGKGREQGRCKRIRSLAGTYVHFASSQQPRFSTSTFAPLHDVNKRAVYTQLEQTWLVPLEFARFVSHVSPIRYSPRRSSHAEIKYLGLYLRSRNYMQR